MLVMILVFAPLIARWKVEPITAENARWRCRRRRVGGGPCCYGESYAKSFWHVARVGVPLMVLAAVLGALAVETIPQTGLHAPATLAGLFWSHLSGRFCRCRWAFDVLFAYVAMSRGVALPYVVTILCTLGIYSVYSFLVVGKTISWRIAAAAGGAVAALGMLAGVAAMGLG